MWATWTPTPNAPTNYTVTSNTVTDGVTHLLWQRNVSPDTYSAASAEAYCSTLVLDGMQGFRVPSRIELASITEFYFSASTINTSAFPNTPAATFWTSTVHAANNGTHWTMDQSLAMEQTSQDSAQLRVRCVAGGVAAAEPDYTVTTTAVVDNLTHLTWLRAPAAGLMRFDEGQTYCASGGWRLPTVHELQTLLDVGVVTPPLRPDAFPGAASAPHWTDTYSDVGHWYVDFSAGGVPKPDGDSLGADQSIMNVRCVL